MLDFLQHLRKHGLVIPLRLAVDALRPELAPHLGPFGRNPFEGEKPQRSYALSAKAPAVVGLVEHEAVLSLVDAFLRSSCLLWGALAINLRPGETRQGHHCDDGAGAPPRPRPARGISVMWPLDEFTEENGATEFIPGSHAWNAGELPLPDDPRTRQAIMPAGSALAWQGSVFHRGGAN